MFFYVKTAYESRPHIVHRIYRAHMRKCVLLVRRARHYLFRVRRRRRRRDALIVCVHKREFIIIIQLKFAI